MPGSFRFIKIKTALFTTHCSFPKLNKNNFTCDFDPAQQSVLLIGQNIFRLFSHIILSNTEHYVQMALLNSIHDNRDMGRGA